MNKPKIKIIKKPNLSITPKNALIILTFSLFIILTFNLLKDIPSPTKLAKGSYPVSTKIYDRHGQLLYEIYADQNRTPISIDKMPPYLLQATIAIEDKNFYHHHGFDTQGILRALYKTLTGQRLEGGSTITQQLVKVALLSPERTLRRKLKEAILALATEILYSKDQILEMYLNHIPYGGTAYGIEAASQLYFHKHAQDLSLAEASLLAGLPQAPSRYSPFINPDKAKLRQKQVLDRMVAEKFITPAQAETAFKEKLNFASPSKNIKAPHFVMYVRQQLEEKYGLQRVEQGGLRVITTLDLPLQEAAQASLTAELDKIKRLKISNGAALITNPATGEILAMVGSKNYFDNSIDGKVNITTRLRQPGSSIKPLNYALGLETKIITPSTMLLDTPICFQIQGQRDYCPKNYDGRFHGPVQIRYALANSYNIPAVKVLALNDVANFIAFAHKMGITTWNDPSKYGLSLTLGGGEVKMLDMAVAFGVFANSGTKVPLHSILKVTDYRGNILEQYQPQQTQQQVDRMAQLEPTTCLNQQDQCPLAKPLSPETAFLISHILSDNQARAAAFGTHSSLYIPGKTVAVKTGTTNNLRDNWTIGYTPNLLVATWVGNNDNSPMSYVASGVTGASPIWHDLMTFALDYYQDKAQDWLQPPTNIESVAVCTDSGVMPAADNHCSTRKEFFIKDTVPTHLRITRKNIWVNRDTHRPPTNPEEFNNVDLEEHLVASDPFVKDYCLDCPPPPEGQHEPPTKVYYAPGNFILNDR